MHFVYLINVENTDIYKIGFSRKNPELRKDKLKTGNSYKLVVTKTYQSHRAKKVENILHNRLLSKKYTEDAKLSGEWFLLGAHDVLGFMDMCKQIESQLEFLEKNSTLFD